MIAIAGLVLVLLVALLVERVAFTALIATGLPFEAARFQARSALTGVGFTTIEAETIVNHPVRRRIVMWLMLLGNAGLITIVGTLFFSFAGTSDTDEVMLRFGLLAAGLIAIGLLARSQLFERALTRTIVKSLDRWTDLEVRDMVNLMQLTSDYAVTEIQVQPGDWVADQPLSELHLPEEGVLVLGVQRADGSFIGAPRGGTVIHAYDMLVLYGRSSVLTDLDHRPGGVAGDSAHVAAVEEQVQIMTEPDEPQDHD
ncbi:MAG: TrkA C-terminal domain-containing protein [Acidimicrobiia bacterium]|nr:TrkA C-terminal domain-containing protein [Acidimicrobiia bacterium]